MKSQIAAAWSHVETGDVLTRPIFRPPLPRSLVFGLGLMLGALAMLAAVLLLTR